MNVEYLQSIQFSLLGYAFFFQNHQYRDLIMWITKSQIDIIPGICIADRDAKVATGREEF